MATLCNAEEQPMKDLTRDPLVVVGVLCIQGAFIEHIKKLKEIRDNEALSLEIREIRKPSDMKDLDGLIIPGGESTTLSVFLAQNGFTEVIKKWMSGQGVVWGTCAGLILLADDLQGQKEGGQTVVCNSVIRICSMGKVLVKYHNSAKFSRAVNFANLPKNLFCKFLFYEFMLSAILYPNNLICAEVIVANL